ncbi:MAG: hypothetical protein HY789_14390, partial [Deltaproteobacteria bacterium]|nr:hypothetical protein [Deltaproteobacteria bacterium]
MMRKSLPLFFFIIFLLLPPFWPGASLAAPPQPDRAGKRFTLASCLYNN